MIEDQIAPLPIIPLSDNSTTPSDTTSQQSKNILTGPARLAQLAKPKPIPPNFIEDRRSVYWTDAPLIVSKNYSLSDRSKYLASHKFPHKDHRGDRPSPIWKVTAGALKGKANARVALLSNAKQVHPDWVPDQPVATQVKRKSLKAVVSDRVIQLSRPKVADQRYIAPSISLTQLDILMKYDRPHGPKFNSLGKVVLEEETVIPAYVERLSNPKGSPSGFRPDRGFRWEVKQATKQAEISARVDELSKIRRVGKRGEANMIVANPYMVSAAARKAQPSSRVQDLAAPIARKQRQKK